MNFIEHIPDLLEAVGTVLIAWAALKVHHRVLHQHKMDQYVFKSMKFEQRLGMFGVLLVVGGFLVRILL